MQFGCWAWVDIIHVSAQPVTPSLGITEATGTFSAAVYCRFTGHAVPIPMSPDLKPSITSAYCGNSLVTSTGATSPAAMSRFVASPEHEHPSYCDPPP